MIVQLDVICYKYSVVYGSLVRKLRLDGVNRLRMYWIDSINLIIDKMARVGRPAPRDNQQKTSTKFQFNFL